MQAPEQLNPLSISHFDIFDNVTNNNGRVSIKKYNPVIFNVFVNWNMEPCYLTRFYDVKNRIKFTLVELDDGRLYQPFTKERVDIEPSWIVKSKYDYPEIFSKYLVFPYRLRRYITNNDVNCSGVGISEIKIGPFKIREHCVDNTCRIRLLNYVLKFKIQPDSLFSHDPNLLITLIKGNLSRISKKQMSNDQWCPLDGSKMQIPAVIKFSHSNCCSRNWANSEHSYKLSICPKCLYVFS